jgi:hypothetical protein
VTSCIVDSAAIYIMVVNFRNTICPPPLQLSLHRRAALSSNSNGTRSVYSRKNPKAVYIVICLWVQYTTRTFSSGSPHNVQYSKSVWLNTIYKQKLLKKSAVKIFNMTRTKCLLFLSVCHRYDEYGNVLCS